MQVLVYGSCIEEIMETMNDNPIKTNTVEFTVKIKFARRKALSLSLAGTVPNNHRTEGRRRFVNKEIFVCVEISIFQIKVNINS